MARLDAEQLERVAAFLTALEQAIATTDVQIDGAISVTVDGDIAGDLRFGTRVISDAGEMARTCALEVREP